MKPVEHSEGYWASALCPLLPTAIHKDRAWHGKKQFLAKLDRVELQANRVQFRGISKCRLCNCQNGGGTFEYLGWRWPQGYSHYIDVHNIKPSAEFFAFVTRCTTDPKIKVDVSTGVTKKEMLLLEHVACAYAGNEQVRLHAMYIVAKMLRAERGQNMPHTNVVIVDESSSEDELRAALKRMGVL